MAHSRSGTFANAECDQRTARVSRAGSFITADTEFLGKLASIDLQRARHQGVGEAVVAPPLTELHVHLAVDAALAEFSKKRSRRHAQVISRFKDFLASKRYEPVYIAEICSAVRVSERTLRTCCHEYFGMGPVRYLWLRRMHLAHRALQRADAATTTVTTIATEHGFWELGRFSVEYRSLFGERPSATLKRSPADATVAVAH